MAQTYDLENIKKVLKTDYIPSDEMYNIMDINKPDQKLGLSEERLNEIKDVFTNWVSFWREYPDLFIDMFKPKNSTFNFFFYQRVFLRSAIRCKYSYFTFTRAFSKSFLAILILIIRCILYPGAKLFIVSGTAKQATQIAKEKIEELLEIFPFLKQELRWKKCNFGKDYVRLVFKNGSAMDIVAARESTRGGRRHAGLMEEVILIDGQKLNEVILPLMNVSRRAKNGKVDPNESLNKSQIYITTAGLIMALDKFF